MPCRRLATQASDQATPQTASFYSELNPGHVRALRECQRAAAAASQPGRQDVGAQPHERGAVSWTIRITSVRFRNAWLYLKCCVNADTNTSLRSPYGCQRLSVKRFLCLDLSFYHTLRAGVLSAIRGDIDTEEP